MTTEEKELLLKDLCARLPYGVVLKVDYIINNETTYGEDVPATCDDKLLRINLDEFSVYTEWLMEYSGIGYIKPYLRPMSSMTEEEFAEYEKANDLDTLDSSETLRENMKAKHRVRISKWYHGTDWLNAHHFDYHGLIEKGIALEAPEGMYK